MVEQQSSYFKNIKQVKKTMAERDQEFVEYIVKQIVNHPEDVKTERTVDEMGVLITLKINQEDMGYVIGKQGQTARSIRTLLKIVGAKEKARVNLKIYEPEGSRMNRRGPAPSSDVDADVEDLKI
ncbi:MAG: KH domain-containing protein [Candidatus Paceibacterota bacterium]|jgi:hypothetical protein